MRRFHWFSIIFSIKWKSWENKWLTRSRNKGTSRILYEGYFVLNTHRKRRSFSPDSFSRVAYWNELVHVCVCVLISLESQERSERKNLSGGSPGEKWRSSGHCEYDIHAVCVTSAFCFSVCMFGEWLQCGHMLANASSQLSCARKVSCAVTNKPTQNKFIGRT